MTTCFLRGSKAGLPRPPRHPDCLALLAAILTGSPSTPVILTEVRRQPNGVEGSRVPFPRQECLRIFLIGPRVPSRKKNRNSLRFSLCLCDSVVSSICGKLEAGFANRVAITTGAPPEARWI